MKKDRLMPRRRFIGFNEEWEQRKFFDNIENMIDFRGRTPKKLGMDWSENGYLALSALNVKPGYIDPTIDAHYGDQELYDKWMSGKDLREGQVLFTTEAPMGNVAQVPDNKGYILSQRTIAFDVDPNKITDDFLAVLLRSSKVFDELSSLSSGGTAKGVSQKSLSQLSVQVPKEIDEQNCIGSFFKRLDLIITLQQRKLEKLQELKKAYLHEMFPTEDENTPKRRFSGFTDDWEQCKLSELATMNARIGWQNLRTSEFLDSGDYMLITGTDFNDGIVNYSTVHYIKKERYDQDKKIQVQNGSILITKDGTLGKVAYVQDLSMPATLNAGVFNVRVIDDSLVDAMYLFHYLSAPFLMDYVTRIATGGTIKHLNQNILVNFPVLLPKIEEQKLISKFLDNLSTTITLQQRKIEKLQELKRAYLNDMFV